MSRSYKKYPSAKCERSCKKGQKKANKKIRRTLQDIPKGNYYKKFYDTWNICDYKFVYFSIKEREKYKKHLSK